MNTNSTLDASLQEDPLVVDDAYTPSGRTTGPAVVKMFLVAAIGVPLAAVSFMMSNLLISEVGAFMLSSDQWMLQFGSLILAFFGAVVVGLFVGSFWGSRIGKAGIKSGNRSPTVPLVLAMVAGVGALVYFYGMRIGEYGAEAFDSPLDWFKFGSYALTALFGLAISTGEAAKRNPFCESCNELMIQTSVATVPAHLEAQVVTLLSGPTPAAVQALPAEPDPERSHLTVGLHYCSECREAGVISATINTLRREETEEGEALKQGSRQVFSQLVDGDVIEPMLGSVPVALADVEDVARPLRSVAVVAPSLSCFTCDARPAEVTSIQRIQRTPEFQGSSVLAFLADRGYLRTEGVLVPRCRPCFQGEKRLAMGAQIAVWTGLAAGAAAGAGVAAATLSGGGAFAAGLVVLVAVAGLIIWLIRRSIADDVNHRKAVDHPAVKMAVDAGATLGAWLIPREGFSPDVLREANFDQAELTIGA